MFELVIYEMMRGYTNYIVVSDGLRIYSICPESTMAIRCQRGGDIYNLKYIDDNIRMLAS